MKSVGIEVGQYSIKWVEISAQGKNLVLSQHGKRDLKLTPGMDQELETIEVLREIVSQFSDPQTKFVLSLGQDRLSVKVKRFPFRERHKILKALPFELEDELPISSDDILYDFKTVQVMGKHTEVLAFAVPKSEILKTLSSASDSGMDPDILSIESIALANLIEPWSSAVPHLPQEAPSQGFEEEIGLVEGPGAPARAVLHLGHTKSLLLCFRDNRLIASRSIYWGGLQVAQSVAKSFSIPVLEAIKSLPHKSFILLRSEGATQDQVRLSNAVSSSFEELLREVKISLLELQSLYHLEFQKIDLTGSLSLVSQLPGFVTQKLELPCNTLRYMDSCGVFIGGWEPQEEAAFSIPLGLALESFKKPGSPAINLRRDEFLKRNRSFERFWEQWRIPIQCAGALLIFFFAYATYRKSLTFELELAAENNLSQQAKTLAQLPTSRSGPSFVERHIRQRKIELRSSETMESLAALRSAMDVVKTISARLPAPRVQAGRETQTAFNIRNLQVNFDTVTIEGVARNAAMAQQIEQSLRGLSVGGQVQRVAPQSTAPPQGEVAFAFQLKVERL